GAIAGLPAADAIGVGAFAVRVEVHRALALVPPQAVQEGAGLGEGRMLARFHLRLGPVDAEDLGPARRELAEVLVEGRIGGLLLVAVAREVLADGLVPSRGLRAREHAPHDDRAPTPDLALDLLRQRAAAQLGEGRRES